MNNVYQILVSLSIPFDYSHFLDLTMEQQTMLVQKFAHYCPRSNGMKWRCCGSQSKYHIDTRSNKLICTHCPYIRNNGVKIEALSMLGHLKTQKEVLPDAKTGLTFIKKESPSTEELKKEVEELRKQLEQVLGRQSPSTSNTPIVTQQPLYPSTSPATVAINRSHNTNTTPISQPSTSAIIQQQRTPQSSQVQPFSFAPSFILPTQPTASVNNQTVTGNNKFAPMTTIRRPLPPTITPPHLSKTSITIKSLDSICEEQTGYRLYGANSTRQCRWPMQDKGTSLLLAPFEQQNVYRCPKTSNSQGDLCAAHAGFVATL